MNSGFDRVRPRSPNAPAANASRRTARVSDGRQSLFSQGDRDGSMGAVRVECSRCGVTSAVSPFHALRLATPSIHDPILHHGHPSFVVCPACRQRSWVKLSLWHR